MDIYSLKADAIGKYYDVQKGYDQWTSLKTAEALMRACENATSVWSFRSLTSNLLDEIDELSTYRARKVKALIRELGYTLPTRKQAEKD